MQKALKGAAWDLEKTNIDLQFGRFNSFEKDKSITLSQSFAFPSVYLIQNKLANANIGRSEWRMKSSQLETATQVKQVYWQLVYLQSKQKLLTYQDSLFTVFTRAAELRAKVGETNRLEMITARSQSLEIKNQLQQMIADRAILNRQLQTLLNVSRTIYPADTVLRIIDFVRNEESQSLNGNPSIGFVNQQIKVSHLEKQLEISRALPDFTLGYFSQTMQGEQEVNGIPRSFGPGDRFNGIQAGIAIPLWFSPFSSKVKVARIKEQISNTDAEYYSKTLHANYQSLLDEFEKYRKSIEYYEKQAVPEAELIIEQSTRSYKAGAMDYLDFVLSLSRALTIRQNYLDAMNSCNQTIIQIEFITGKIF